MCIKKIINGLKYGLFEDNRVGIIKVEGIIIDAGNLSSSSKVIESFENAEKMGIKNIVLRINSPGGTVGASQEIYREIKKYQKEGMKIVASLGDLAASGGLYVAVAADKIVSNPGTVTGSIGVIIKTNVVKKLYKKIGIDSQTVKSGKFKDILSSTKNLSEEEKEILQELIDSTYEQFVESISENRNIDKEDIKKFADGRIFSGLQAKKLGLVDEIGSQSDAVDLVAKIAGMKKKPISINLSPKKSFMQKITGSNLQELLENAGVNAFYKKTPLWLMPDF
ncbi:MAG TPA: signal peptide peptidase SppA [Candidatus Gastranaerophilales bacterium]|nr:signal peptide peptidase SppA [Candidatus Gastranaerophilales bacterium]